jgi:hypothetical protein
VSILQLNEFMSFSSLLETLRMFTNIEGLKPADLVSVLEAGPQPNTYQLKHTLRSNFPM